MRGACAEPVWHSIGAVLDGEYALSRLYRNVKPGDLPFAQDCLGDQFLLRDRIVHRLLAETGDVESLEVNFEQFCAKANEAPVGFLGLQPLLLFQQRGGRLGAGQSLMVYPPFCFEESAEGVWTGAIDTLQLLMAHARLAQALADRHPGDKINFCQIMGI